MQSNRTIGLVLLVILAVGTVVAWQFLGDPSSPIAPDPDATNSTESSEIAKADVAKTANDDGGASTKAGVREAVMPVDPGTSELPSLVGRVVGANDRPIADAEVLCAPGAGFTPDLSNFDPADLDDVDMFDPQANVARMEQAARDRVAVRSDADGRFRIRVEGTSKKVSLRVLARGYLVLNRTVSRPAERDADLGELMLEPGAVIAGRVLDATGSTVEGASVSRLLPIEENMPAGMDFVMPGMEAMNDLRTGEVCVTDAGGRFELPHTPAGEFTLRARHSEYPTVTKKDLSVAKGQSLTDILLTMPRSAQIRGTVTGVPAGMKGLKVMAAVKPQAQSGPAAGFMGMLGNPAELLDDMGMTFSERQSDIASDGSFVLRGLKAARTYRVWVGQLGRGFAGTSLCSERIEARAGASGIELQYETGVTVTFEVIDASSGEPVQRLWVRDRLRGNGGLEDMMALAPSQAQERPYPGGKVTVPNLRPKKDQKLRLTIDAIGYAQLQRDKIDLPASGSLDLGTLRLEPRPIVEVTVLTKSDNRPVVGALVRLREQQEQRGNNPFAQLADLRGGSSPTSGRTNSAGKCMLNALDADASELMVTHRGFAPAVDGPFAAGGSASSKATRTVLLVVGGSAEVTVLNPDKKPVVDGTVEHRTAAGDTDRQKTDANGVARFAHLLPGTHEFRLGQGGGMLELAMRARRSQNQDAAELPWQSVDILDQQTATLVLEKAPTAVVRGIVRENGVPLAGAKVTFAEGADNGSSEAVAAELMGSMMGRMGGSSRRQATTDDNGIYELSELPSGEHRLRISHRDRAMTTTAGVTLRDGDNVFDADLDMTSLRGIVRDPRGNPVDGARVSVSQKRGANGEAGQARRLMAGMMPGMGFSGPTQKTGASGAYELRGVTADVPLEIRATKKGLAPAAVEATVELGQTKTQVDLRLGEAGSIQVTVAKAGMFASAQATFVGPDAESVEPVMQMLRRGKGKLSGLRPGTWEVSYRGMNRRGATQKQTVEVIAGQTVAVDF